MSFLVPILFWHQGLVWWKTIFPWTLEVGDGFGVIEEHFIQACLLLFGPFPNRPRLGTPESSHLTGFLLFLCVYQSLRVGQMHPLLAQGSAHCGLRPNRAPPFL